jgi:ribonuclease HI
VGEVMVTCPHCGQQHGVDPDKLKRDAGGTAAGGQGSLFSAGASSTKPAKRPALSPEAAAKRAFVLEFDGGSRGNPGPAGLGVRLITEDGVPLYELGEFIPHATSNVAEYTGLLRGLNAALKWQASKLTIRADSELVVRQLNGQYKVKSPDLRPMYEQALRLIDQIGNVKIFHVYRENNKRCDFLANQAMDKRAKLEPLGPLPE